MIYDGHAYCIPDQKGDGGFEDRNEFQRLLQFNMGHHFQPTWRTRDRTLADSSELVDLSRPLDVEAVKEANFRPAAHGRFEWEVDGERYFKNVMPPLVTDMIYTAGMAVAEMDYAGVDWALLHRTPYLGISNDWIADCCRQYPDRIQGLAYVREWLIPADPEAAAREVERSITELGLHGLQVLPYFSLLHGITEDWDSGRYQPFWDAVEKMNIPVFFTLVALQEKTLEGYLGQLRMLRRWMERYPDVDRGAHPRIRPAALRRRGRAVDSAGGLRRDSVRQPAISRADPVRGVPRARLRLPDAAAEADPGGDGEAHRH